MTNCFESHFREATELKPYLGSCGKDVHISSYASIVGNPKNLHVGDHVRIDDFCVIIASGPIHIGNYVHIAHYVLLQGGAGISIDDFSTITNRCSLITQSDDPSGNFMTGVMVPAKYRNDLKGRIDIGKHCHIGAGSVILPDVTVSLGVVVGALSLVTKSLDPYGLYVGIPAKRLKDRNRDFEKLEKELINGV